MILGMWLDVTLRIFSILEIWLLVLNVKRLLFRKRTHVGLPFAMCVRLPWFWRALIPSFPFRENCSSSFALFSMNFRALRNLHSLKFPSKASFPYALMVGFEFLSQECPPISFFFARLGVFLEYSSSWRPQVGLFVSRFFALRPILLSLYPLICQSLIKHHLEMTTIEYRVDDVRSSELETGLSSNTESLSKVVDTAASKLPSSSSSFPLLAFLESCSLKEKHLNDFRKRFQFPKRTSVRLPHLGKKAWNFAYGEVCFYEANFLRGWVVVWLLLPRPSVYHASSKRISNRPWSARP